MDISPLQLSNLLSSRTDVAFPGTWVECGVYLDTAYVIRWRVRSSKEDKPVYADPVVREYPSLGKAREALDALVQARPASKGGGAMTGKAAPPRTERWAAETPPKHKPVFAATVGTVQKPFQWMVHTDAVRCWNNARVVATLPLEEWYEEKQQ